MRDLLDEVCRTEDLLSKGLHEINEKGDITEKSLDQMGKLLDAAKDMFTIQMRAESEDGYSERGNYGRYSNDWDRMDGASYARRRDSRGRYSRAGYSREGGYSRAGYSREGANDEMIEMLEEKMRNAVDATEREKYRKMILELENH